MNIEDVRTFVAVVEAGSLSRAARELHLTQPAVTRRVQRLEQALGATLIDRKLRPLALTDFGRAALTVCRRLTSATTELRAIARSGPLLTRECRIGVAHALTELALCEPVDEMRRRFPTIALRLYTGWSRDLLESVRNGALDAAIILLPRRDRIPVGTNGTRLARENLKVVAPRRWPSGSCTIREIADAGWILNPEGCAARSWLRLELGKAGSSLRVSVEAFNYELQMSLVARDRGLGLVPDRLLRRSPTRDQLRALRIRGLEFPMTIWMVTGELAPALQPPFRALSRILSDELSGLRKMVKAPVANSVRHSILG